MTAKLGLGTVQWGIPYGIANKNGQTPESEVSQILSSAKKNDVVILDTAAGYGQAETILGKQDLSTFQIVTKIPSFNEGMSDYEQKVFLIESLNKSLETLRISKIYGFLFHNANNLLTSNSEILISTLLELKSQGLVEKIGVSIYDDEQLKKILDTFTPDIIQLPINILDQRLIHNGRLAQLNQLGIEIHARSVFLQGLLLIELDSLPNFFSPIKPLLKKIQERAKEQQISLLEAALSFVRDLEWIDTVLVGVESKSQFLQCLKNFNVKKSFDATGLDCNLSQFINPTEWKIK